MSHEFLNGAIPNPCVIRMKRGWRCTRPRHYTGPCALVPRWWNWSPSAIKYRWAVHGGF